MLVKVILSGGNGKRLFPLSTDDHPKQYLSFYHDERCLLDQVLSLNIGEDLTLIVSSIKDQERLEPLQSNRVKVIYEPFRRDTSAAVLFACIYLRSQYPQQSVEVVVLPSDNIVDQDEINRCLTATRRFTDTYLITFGVVPDYPATVYGYIRVDQPIADHLTTVKYFKEKPNLETAQIYLTQGDHLWNSGIYYSNLNYFLQLMRTFSCNYDSMGEYVRTGNHKHFSDCQSISFDVDISEKCKSLLVYRYREKWVDVGNWKAVYDCCPADLLDGGRNFIKGIGEVKTLGTEGSLIMNTTPLPVKVLGLKSSVVVLTPDGLLISDIEHCHRLKEIV